MRATPLMIAIALGLGASVVPGDASARQAPPPAWEKAEGRQTWIVVFEEAPAAAFRGFEPGDGRRPKLAPTSPAATGHDRYDAQSPEARAYTEYLGDLQRLRLGDMSAKLGRPLEPVFRYVHATNGVALLLTKDEAAALRDQPGVKRVTPEFLRYPQTNFGPGWINADEVWSGAATGVPRRGEGVVVGVIDTGINRNHVAFAQGGTANSLGGYRGYCVSVPNACNNKLVGLWDFTVASNGIGEAADTDGHGTHVASTAAGGPYISQYSGVAPRANIIAYKACPDGEEACLGSALVASIDQAVADGVDVINYSIGGGPRDPWLYQDSFAFLAAREAGVVVAAAAGNDGPDAGTLSSPSNSPWVMSVAAATHDRNGVDSADILAGFSGRGPVRPFSVLKPNLTAPGVQIVAAGHTGTQSLTQMSGTSMATPHVAGAAALLKSTNLNLTADQITSALQLTARPSIRRSPALPPVDPHQQGSGATDVALAAKAGLYLEVAPGSFRNASEAVFTGGAENLNLPALAQGGCFMSCQLTRTFKAMPGAAGTTYSVQASLSKAGASITPSVAGITASASGSPVTLTISLQDNALLGQWVYGEVNLVNTSGNGRPDLRLPVAVYFSAVSDESGVPGEITINAEHERGFVDVQLGSIVSLPNARFATSDLAPSQSQVRTIPADPTNDDPFDVVGQNYIDTFQVPAGPGSTFAVRVTTSAPQPDVDLFVGRDSNNDGIPQASEVVCVSGSPESNEECAFTVPGTSGSQAYWLMVQNWSGPGTNVRISRAVVSSAAGSGETLVATGPGETEANEDFTVRVAYDDPGMGPSEERMGFLRIEATPGDPVLEIPVVVKRTGSAPSPFALAPGQARRVKLQAGQAHDTLVFDVPANATSVSFKTVGSGSVSLYAAHVANPGGPVIQPAPARNAAGVISATAAGANQTITVSGASLKPGRWYVTPVNTGGSATEVEVSASIGASSGSLAVRPGSYYAPGRGGHGIFMYPSGDQQAVLWYTYFQDGSPTWYYMQAPQPGGNGSWTTPIYRASWNGSANHLVEVGEAVFSARTDQQFSFAYNLDGFTGVESMDAFLVGCPGIGGTPVDASGHWFDPARAGTGYSVQLNPNYEFYAAFIYDELGVPRFLAAERGGAFDAGNGVLALDQLQGFAPLGAYSAPVRTNVGSLQRQFTGSVLSGIVLDANFAGGVSGAWSENDAVVPLGGTQGCP